MQNTPQGLSEFAEHGTGPQIFYLRLQSTGESDVIDRFASTGMQVRTFTQFDELIGALKTASPQGPTIVTSISDLSQIDEVIGSLNKTANLACIILEEGFGSPGETLADLLKGDMSN